MGKIIRNGIEYGGTYDTANSVNYDNSISGLNARTVQEGIDKLNESLIKFDTCDLLGTNASTTETTINADLNNYKLLVLGEFYQSNDASNAIVTIPLALFKTTKIFVSRYNGSGSSVNIAYGAKATYVSDTQFTLKILTQQSDLEARLYGIK